MRLFRFFLTWWGMYLIAALDASMMFFLPFGVDAVVIFLAARDRELAWLYPLLATAGSITGAAATYWIGQKIGEIGLARYVPSRRLERLQARVRNSGAIALAIPALLPPPFPLTPFVLTCGALRVNPWRFFTVFGAMRLVRFGTEAALALVFGRKILQILRSDTFQIVVVGFIVLAVVGTIISAVLLWRSTRRQEVRT
ncbi:MAG TPA: VTT domain-containing protein [Vicinamibacterales bacterium]|nr:VTT domain-containing protein [Vicinamibacterales bacterium]